MEQRCDLFGLDRPFFLQPHQRIKRRRGRRERRNMIFEHPFTARIRFNSGYCNAGNVGSADRTDYTIVGAEDPAAGHSIAEPGGVVISSERAGPACLNRFSASISGGSAGIRPPRGAAEG
jgi:hypothetical protein